MNQSSQFIVKIAETAKEKKQAYDLRYQELVLAFSSENTNDTGSDITEYDQYAEQLIVIDTMIDQVVGCYRLVTNGSLKEQKFMCEDEFNIQSLRKSKQKILELSRAIVKAEYRTGVVIKLMWGFLFTYSRKMEVRYIIGDASFSGIEPKKYQHSLSYLYYNHSIDDKYEIKSTQSPTPINFLDENKIDPIKVKEELPTIVKAYLSFGAKTSKEYFIDYEFKSVDVFVLIDMKSYNDRYVSRLLKI